jgi:GxxExxY protein
LLLQDEDITKQIIGAAIEVHRALGPGLLESAYQSCLGYELEARGIQFQREVPLPVVYRGNTLECGYRIDFDVQGAVVVELKCVEKLGPIHEAQLLTYLRLAGRRTGLLINFNVPTLKDGVIRRVL